MQSLVIVGNLTATENYIEEFISSKKIKSYNVINLLERVKISDVREVKKSISFKVGKKESRVVVIKSDITIDAQNALLKTLEELNDENYFIIVCSNKETLIPTILSRSKITRLDATQEKEEEKLFEKEIELLIKGEDKVQTALLVSQRLEGVGSNELLDRFLIELRGSLLKAGTRGDKVQLKILWEITSQLNLLYPLLTQNNINKRLALENIILSLN